MYYLDSGAKHTWHAVQKLDFARLNLTKKLALALVPVLFGTQFNQDIECTIEKVKITDEEKAAAFLLSMHEDMLFDGEALNCTARNARENASLLLE